MARNGSGVYAKVNTFIAGNVITASGHNQNWDDIATEMTNSVAADGQTAITGPLKHASGTAASPSMTFAADTDTGFYRSAADEVSLALGGNKAYTLGSSGILDGGGALLTVLIGEAKIWCLPTAPTGFIFLRGQACTTTYPQWRAALIAAANPFGTSGSDPLFPNFQTAVPAGVDVNRGGLNGSGTFGAFLGGQFVTLSTSNLPPYTPSGTVGITDPGHSHSVSGGTKGSNGANNTQAGTGASIVTPVTDISVVGNFTGITGSFNGSAQGGTSTPFSVVQPTIIVNFIGRAA